MSSTDHTVEITGKEMGLIKNLSQRNRQLKWTKDDLELSQNVAKEMLYTLGGSQSVFSYHIKLGHWDKAYEPTYIGDYTNKKGFVSKAHFTISDTYYGSVRKLGTSPVMVLQNVPIEHHDCAERWTVSPTAPHRLIPIKK